MAVCMLPASKGDVTELKKMLEEDPTLVNSACESHGFTPLMLACEYGHKEAATLLLGLGADVHVARKQGGETALHLAAARGHPELVILLLRYGAEPSVEATNPADFTPMMAAANNGHLEVVRVILEADRRRFEEGKDRPEQREKRHADGEKSVWLAAGAGKADILQLLLVNDGVEWARRDNKARSIVEFAKARGHVACVNVLKWFEGEQSRVYNLARARAVVDDSEAIAQAPGKAKARTTREAHQARVDASPDYLRTRVQTHVPLPVLDMPLDLACGSLVAAQGLALLGKKRPRTRSCGLVSPEQEARRITADVLHHVVKDMKADPFTVLMDMLRVPALGGSAVLAEQATTKPMAVLNFI